MQITQLIERLESIAEAYPDAEIRVAHQPSYPLAAELAGVTDPDDMDRDPTDPDDELIVWLVAGDHPITGSPYAPRDLWEIAH